MVSLSQNADENRNQVKENIKLNSTEHFNKKQTFKLIKTIQTTILSILITTLNQNNDKDLEKIEENIKLNSKDTCK